MTQGLGMKTAFLAMGAVGLVAVFSVMGAAVFDPPNDDVRASLAVGEMSAFSFTKETRPAPGATVADADGDATSLAEYRGQVVLLNLWATWCPPCVAELPDLAVLAETYEDRPFVLVPVSLDREGPAEARAFLDNLGLQALPSWNDKTLGIAAEVTAKGFPTSILYDARGMEIGRVEAMVDWTSDEAFRLIDAALAGELGIGPNALGS